MNELYSVDVVYRQEVLTDTFYTFIPNFLTNINNHPILDTYPFIDEYNIHRLHNFINIEGNLSVTILYKSEDFTVKYYEVKIPFSVTSTEILCDEKLNYKVTPSIPKEEIYYRITGEEILLHGCIQLDCIFYYSSDVYLLPKPYPDEKTEILLPDIEDKLHQLDHIFFPKK